MFLDFCNFFICLFHHFTITECALHRVYAICTYLHSSSRHHIEKNSPDAQPETSQLCISLTVWEGWEGERVGGGGLRRVSEAALRVVPGISHGPSGAGAMDKCFENSLFEWSGVSIGCSLYVPVWLGRP